MDHPPSLQFRCHPFPALPHSQSSTPPTPFTVTPLCLAFLCSIFLKLDVISLTLFCLMAMKMFVTAGSRRKCGEKWKARAAVLLRMRHLSLPLSSLLSHHLTLCKLVWVLNVCRNVTLISRILKQGKGVSEKEKSRRWCVVGGVVPYPGATVPRACHEIVFASRVTASKRASNRELG